MGGEKYGLLGSLGCGQPIRANQELFSASNGRKWEVLTPRIVGLSIVNPLYQ